MVNEQQTNLPSVDNGVSHPSNSRQTQCAHGSQWQRFLIILAISGWVMEKRLQHKNTGLPLVLRQKTDRNDVLCSLLSSVLLRKMRPAIFGSTRAMMKNLVRSMNLGLRAKTRSVNEIMESPSDGSRVNVVWQLPESCDCTNESAVLSGPIKTPVVLTVPNLGDGADSDYVQRLIKTCNDYGWIAVAIDNKRHFRGLEPRSELDAGISDVTNIRNIVSTISMRMQENQPIFLLGVSQGGNAVINYLGEHGMTNSTPPTLAGAVSVNLQMSAVEDDIRDPHDALNEPMTRLWCRNHIALVDIPVMVISQDFRDAQKCLSNPNVIIVKPNTGEVTEWNYVHRVCCSKAERASASWVDVVVTKFFNAVLRSNEFGVHIAKTAIDEVEPGLSDSTSFATNPKSDELTTTHRSRL